MKIFNKLLFVLIFSLAGISITYAAEGDTTKVKAHDDVAMTWYGNYEKWAVFPTDTSKSYRKIIMHYTMGCPSSGCSDWDYTTKIELLNETGEIDSTLDLAPNFKVNGSKVDSVKFSSDTTWVYSYNSSTKSMDTNLNSILTIYLYNDVDPYLLTDSINVWTADYYNYIYDSSGNITDSTYVSKDSTWVTTYTNVYTHFNVTEPFELGRVITPYAGDFSTSWKRTYSFDVTDYAPLLRDSVKFRAHYSGYSSGFSVTLDFDFIEGIPVREVLKVENLYRVNAGYDDGGTTFDANYMPAKDIDIGSDVSQLMLRVIPSGHGFDNDVYCAEFCEKDYYVKVGGSQKYSQNMWRDDCGANPLYPQAGTWLYDRANWCPGTKVIAYDHDLTSYITPGQSVNLDVDVEFYNWSGNQSPYYIIEVQLFHYKEPSFELDAELEAIIAPNINDKYLRDNPICNNPKVLIKNTGKTTLENLNIRYGVVGGPINNYKWEGSLDFLESEEVTLESMNKYNLEGDTTQFEVTIGNPNGTPDGYLENNTLRSYYDPLPMYPEEIVLWLTCNNAASENAYTLTDDAGNVLYSRNNMTNGESYKDTFVMDQGCYQFHLTDSDKDGLSWWANNDGSGSVRFRRVSGSPKTIITFEADFGSEIKHNFTVGYQVDVEEEVNSSNFNIDIYPNPGTSIFEVLIDFIGNNEEVVVTLISIFGQEIKTYKYYNSQNAETLKLDLTELSSGIYFIKVEFEEWSQIKKIVKH